MIILHYTGMENEEAALTRLCDPAAKVSAHYVVNESGGVHQLVDDNHRAWHAGVSYWNGVIDINSHSIGIEIVNPGHEFGYRTFPDAQIAALTKLCKQLMKTHSIKPSHVLGHSDIAPARKDDPGELFPWQQLGAHGIGVWPDETKSASMSEPEFIKALVVYGYNPDTPADKLITAFHRHFCPEKFAKGQNPAAIDNLSISRLNSLLNTQK